LCIHTTFSFFFGGARVWTQCFTFAKQALYCLSNTFNPFLLWLFWKGSLENYLSSGSQTPKQLGLQMWATSGHLGYFHSFAIVNSTAKSWVYKCKRSTFKEILKSFASSIDAYSAQVIYQTKTQILTKLIVCHQALLSLWKYHWVFLYKLRWLRYHQVT
jgi:hypothetical protein